MYVKLFVAVFLDAFTPGQIGAFLYLRNICLHRRHLLLFLAAFHSLKVKLHCFIWDCFGALPVHKPIMFELCETEGK